MVERRVCAFCGNEIEPGTGRMYVKVDGTTFNFCKNKCLKNMIELHRVPRKTAWTQPYSRDKAQRMPAKETKAVKKKGKGKPTKMKVKKPAKKVAKKVEKKEVKKSLPPPPKKKAPTSKAEGEKKGTEKSKSD
jgi:large subunit ribosomal protein L24e